MRTVEFDDNSELKKEFAKTFQNIASQLEETIDQTNGLISKVNNANLVKTNQNMKFTHKFTYAIEEWRHLEGYILRSAIILHEISKEFDKLALEARGWEVE